MGTTKTAIETEGAGVRLAFVAAIEGYGRLIHSWESSSAVNTAWAGTDWNGKTHVKGLIAPETFEQSIKMLRPSIDYDTVRFRVVTDSDDSLGQELWAREKSTGNSCQLTADIDSNDTTISTTSTASFASSGELFIGTECIAYSSKSSSTFTASTRGKYSPFAVSGGTRFGRPHKTSQVSGRPVAFPVVTDYPRTWIGKLFGCWAHRVVGGVLDTKAQAELIYAGRISDIEEDESGNIIFAVTDVREMVANKVLLNEQWTAEPEFGILLSDGDVLRVGYVSYSGSFVRERDDFVIGTDLAAGYYSSVELISAVNGWLNTSSTLSIDVALRVDPVTAKVTMTMTAPSALGSLYMYMHLSPSVRKLLGFESTSDSGGLSVHDARYEYLSAGDLVTLVSDSPHPKVYSIPASVGMSYGTANASGSFVDQSAHIPEPFATRYGVTTADSWGFVLQNDFVFLVKHVSDTELVTYMDPELALAFSSEGYERATFDEDGNLVSSFPEVGGEQGDDKLTLRQVIILSGRIDTLIPRLLYSTGTTDYNSSTYDKYDYQLGAGIPHDLLGDAFVNTCVDMASMAPDYLMGIMIEKPTKLDEIISSEMALRNAHLVFKDGGIVFAIPSAQSSTTALHSLTTSNKSAKIGSAHSDLPATRLSNSDVVNAIKVEYDRDVKGDFHKVIEIQSIQSQTDHGVSNPVTIKARNVATFASGGPTDAVRDLAENLGAFALSVFSRPRAVLSRSLSRAKFFMFPGDTVRLTDNFIRDPQTGQRGISSASGYVLGTTVNWRTGIGSADIVLVPDAGRRAAYSPAADVDETYNTGSFLAGFDSSTNTLRCTQNSFSFSGATKADAEYFVAGDLVTITEVSPANPASPTTWDRTVVSSTADTIVISSGLAGYDTTGATKYRVVSQIYSSAVSTQQSDCYLADNADLKVLDTVNSYLWATQAIVNEGATTADAREQHEYPSDVWHTEGYPVHPGMHAASVKSLNNLINYRTAPQSPQLLVSPRTTDSETYELMATFPFFVGYPSFTERIRYIRVAPRIGVDNSSATVTCRVTVSPTPPTGSDFDTAAFAGYVSQVEFSHTGDTAATIVTRDIANVVKAAGVPYVWITVELKIDDGAYNATFYGLSELWLSEVDV